jgi:hypothetical protein
MRTPTISESHDRERGGPRQPSETGGAQRRARSRTGRNELVHVSGSEALLFSSLVCVTSPIGRVFSVWGGSLRVRVTFPTAASV